MCEICNLHNDVILQLFKRIEGRIGYDREKCLLEGLKYNLPMLERASEADRISKRATDIGGTFTDIDALKSMEPYINKSFEKIKKSTMYDKEQVDNFETVRRLIEEVEDVGKILATKWEDRDLDVSISLVLLRTLQFIQQRSKDMFVTTVALGYWIIVVNYFFTHKLFKQC